MSSVVQLVDVGKRYVKYQDVPTLLTGLVRMKRGGRDKLWAVRHVDVELPRGESLGVIGRNGSGKSTMLSIVAGVTAPTEGIVRVQGRVAPLLQVGVGFHPELTGRENVHVNATILGLRRREIDTLLDDIVEFSEIGGFIDTPVKFYSSGMRMRLGFATAVTVNPDVLLVDEVLAVGDLAFQARCLERMLELQRNGATFVVVSHAMDAIQRVCRHVLVLHNGAVAFFGPTDEAIGVYYELLESTEEDEGRPDAAVRIVDFRLLDGDGEPTAQLRTGDWATLRIRAKFFEAVDDPAFGVALLTQDGHTLYLDTTAGTGTRRFEAGEEVDCDVRLRMTLATGTYRAGAAVRWGRENTQQVNSRLKAFHVAGRPLVEGVLDLEGTFTLDDSRLPDATEP